MLSAMLRAVVGNSEAGGIPTDYITLYTMDNIIGSTLVDETGNHNGTITGATAVTGHMGNALSFDGAGDYVQCGSAGQSTSFSLSLWIETTAENQRVFDAGRGTGSRGAFSGWNLKSFDADFLTVDDGAGNYINISPDLDGIPNFADGVMNHVVVTYDGSSGVKEAKYYLNNVLEKAKQNLAIGTVNGPYNSYVGVSSLDQFTQPLTAKIDQMYIYDRVITDVEIAALYNEV